MNAVSPSSWLQRIIYSSREDLLAREAWDLYPQRSDRETLLRALDAGQTLTNVRMQYKRKDGSQITGIVNARMIETEGNDPQILGTLVTEPEAHG